MRPKAGLPDGTEFRNKASIVFDSEPPMETSEVVHVLRALANLSLTKGDDPDPVTAGQNLIYTIEVTNNGPDTATGASLTDTLPAGVTFVSANASQGTCNEAGGTVTCDLGTINVGDSVMVTIVVTPNAAGVRNSVSPITNTAAVASNETDPDTTNNTLRQPFDTPAATQGKAQDKPPRRAPR